MQTVFRLNADDGKLRNGEEEIDETAHLLSTQANREHLLRALADVEAGRNLISAPSGVFE